MEARRPATRSGGKAIAAIILVMTSLVLAGPSPAQEDTSPESKALNHERFVSGSIAACRQACGAGSGPFEGQEGLTDGCDETCACVGDQLGARITGDDLWSMYQAERGGVSRAEAMAPYVPAITMGYKACGFELP